MLIPDKMLLSMPEHYPVIYGCKSKCTKSYKCKNNVVDCIRFCKSKELCETWKDILENIFWRNWGTIIKKKKVKAFADFLSSYVYYDFVLALFSYRSYST